MKTRWFLVVAVLLVVLGAAFALLNFRFISSQSKADSMVSSMLGGRVVGQQNFSTPVTGLYVDGRGLVKSAVQARVKRLIQNQAAFGEISDLNIPADKMDISVLYIEVSPVEFFWTPFYARSKYLAVVSYATNGDVSFRKQAAPHFATSGDQPMLQVQGTLTLTDASQGVMSLPGYEDYLAGKLADWAVETVRSQMKQMQPASEGD